ncbi:S24/S26 family peptidase [Butyricicoccus sp.]|uniref:S24/S26 family peptidase n=1 Tax=Butyricicoccus sp. TaxID=2049021 RepID=UPI003F13E2E5
MKVVDTKEYVSTLRELVQEGQEVSMQIAGSSMSPFLVHQRDSICFRAPTQPLRRGDMVFYQRTNGQFVMHRICRVHPEGYYIVGDAQTEIEGPIARTQIFAVVTRVYRKGTWIDATDFWWKFFAGPWLWIVPFRHKLIRLYHLLGFHRNK